MRQRGGEGVPIVKRLGSWCPSGGRVPKKMLLSGERVLRNTKGRNWDMVGEL